MAELSDVYFVDGMRTPFGRAGEKGMYWNTRSDDLAVKATIGLMERNPDVPADRVDDVAIAATSQTGEQGLTLGRSVAILAGLPQTVPGFAIDRMCAGSMTSVAMMGASIGAGMYEVALAGGDPAPAHARLDPGHDRPLTTPPRVGGLPAGPGFTLRFRSCGCAPRS